MLIIFVHSVYFDFNTHCGHLIGTKPKVDFVTLLKSQDVHEGADAKFSCELSGDALKMEWIHKDLSVSINFSKWTILRNIQPKEYKLFASYKIAKECYTQRR